MAPKSLQLNIGERLAPFKDKIFRQMSQLKNSGSKLERELGSINKDLTEKQKLLDNLMSQERNMMESGKAEPLLLNDIALKIQSQKAQIKSDLAAADKLKDNMDYVKLLIGKTNEFNNVLEKDGIVSATKYLDNLNTELESMGDMSLLTELQQLKGWYAGIKPQVKKMSEEILSSTMKSGNLEAPKKFIKEFGRMHSLPDGNPVKEAWLNNPDNIKMMHLLENPTLSPSPRISRLFNEMKTAIESKKPMGLTPREIASKFKIPAAVIGSGVVVGAGVLNWFSSNSPEKITRESIEHQNALDKFNATGMGKAIKDQAKKAMTNIQALQQPLDNGMVLEDPGAATMTYISSMSKELRILSSALGQWDTVVRSADNKDIAQQAGQQIYEFVSERVAAFNDLARQVGATIVSAPTKPTTIKDEAGKGNISKIQTILQQQVNPAIKITGNLDSDTLSALKQLEQTYNKRAETTDFTGLFVNPALNYVISENNLKEAINRINKY